MGWALLGRSAVAILVIAGSTIPAACGDPWFHGWIMADANDGAVTGDDAGGKPVVRIARSSVRWSVSGACVSRGLMLFTIEAKAVHAPIRVAVQRFGFAVGERTYTLDRVTDGTGVDVSRNPDNPKPRILYTIDHPAPAELVLPAGERHTLLVTFDQPQTSSDRLSPGRKSVLTLPTPQGETGAPVRLRCG